jgi:hypothetical protein
MQRGRYERSSNCLIIFPRIEARNTEREETSLKLIFFACAERRTSLANLLYSPHLASEAEGTG